MAAELVVSIGTASQVDAALNGEHLKGRREPRVAFVGRSNVGKSSLLNALTGGKTAYVSKQPGKTRLIHAHLWKEARTILVDLPGYGFAKTAKTDQDEWAKLITYYVEHDEKLIEVLVLLDSRHDPSPQDEAAIDFFISLGVPISFVMSKKDALKRQADRAAREKAFRAWFERRNLSGPIFWVSTVDKKEGLHLLARHVMQTPDRITDGGEVV